MGVGSFERKRIVGNGTLKFDVNMVDITTPYTFIFSQTPFSKRYTETNTTSTLLNAKSGSSTGKNYHYQVVVFHLN